MDEWSWFIALDGEDLDGLIGKAGLLRFDWPSKTIKHCWYPGLSGGHNISLHPTKDLALYGSFSQQLALVDTNSLEILKRETTMGVEECDYRLKSSTHFLWEDDDNFICVIGDHLYKYNINDLKSPTKLGKHGLDVGHEIRWSHDKRYIMVGDIGPENAGARQICVFDRLAGPTVIQLPGTVWHVEVHPTKPLGYAATYTTITEDADYVDWAPAYAREYIFEIDLETAKISRVWSSGAEFPIHLNSDIVAHCEGDEDKLYLASGGSHTVCELDLNDFATVRTKTVTPNWWYRFWSHRQRHRNVKGAFMRKSPVDSVHMVLQATMVSGGRLFDGVYATRISPDGKYIVAGNRGYNYIEVIDRATMKKVYGKRLPKIEGGYHLGLHHSEIRSLNR